MNCRACSKPLDAHSEVSDNATKPTPGSLSVCFYCGTLSTFTEDLSLRTLTDAELADVKNDTPVWKVLEALWAAIGNKNQNN